MIASILLTVHIIVALAIVGLVLIQHGKGADMGAAFGSGSAGSVFGSAGAANFLSRSTAICAAIFFCTSLGLTYFHAPKGGGSGVTSGVTKSAPAKSEAAKAADAIPTPADANKAATPPNPQQIPK